MNRFCTGFRNLMYFNSIRNKSSRISKVTLAPLPSDSRYIKPCRMHYVENGVDKIWDMFKIIDGVLIFLYNTTRQKLIYVRQFRPSVYHALSTKNALDFEMGPLDVEKNSPELGMTLEVCAGLLDKSKKLEEIAREEILEECGYDVPIESIELIYKYRSGVGTSSGSHYLFYCEVCDEQKISKGGGVDGEVIEVVELSIDEAREMVKQGSHLNSPPGSILSTIWFLANKAPKV